MRRITFLLIIGIAGVAALLALGSWQVRRLASKQHLLASIEARIHIAPVALPMHPDAANDRYLPVTVHGTIEAGEVRVLVSIPQVGPGFRIIAPMLTDAGRRILLDRGAVPDARRDATRQTGAVTVTGNLDWPRETDRFTPAPDRAANIWFARDVAAMARALDTEPVLLVAGAGSRTDASVTPLPVSTAGIPDNHLQYAITWFLLALVWAAMTAHFLRRQRARHPS